MADLGAELAAHQSPSPPFPSSLPFPSLSIHTYIVTYIYVHKEYLYSACYPTVRV